MKNDTDVLYDGMDEIPGQAGDDVWYRHDDVIFRCRISTIECNSLHLNSLTTNIVIKSNKTATKVSKSELFWLSHSTKIIKNSKGCTTRPRQYTERTAVALLPSLHSRPAHLHSNAWASLLFVSCARARKPLCCRDSVYIR